MILRSCYLSGLLCLVFTMAGSAADWPMLGRDVTRNAVSLEKHPPRSWQIEQRNRKTGALEQSSLNIKWVAELGSYNYAAPTVVNGKVWIGSTVNDPGKTPTRDSALLCFDEATGTPLYHYRSPKTGNYRQETVYGGIGCSPLVEGQHLWFVTNRAEAIALDLAPLEKKADPVVRWKLDMEAELKVQRAALMMGPPRTCSIAASLRNKIYITTGHGRTYSIEVDKPLNEAPSLLCVDKITGKVLWSDSSAPPEHLFGQFASPLVAQIGERWQVIVPQGDGWIRAFDADTGKPLWWFDMNAKEATHLRHYGSTRSIAMGTPVLYEQRVYIAQGAIPERGEGLGRLVCLDPTRKGDISADLIIDRDGKPIEEQRVDAQRGERVAKNPNAGVIWEFRERDVDNNGRIDHWFERMFGTQGSVAIKDNLLVVGDKEGFVRCFDARTGELHWTHDHLCGIWNSPLIVDDTIYVANDNGEVAVYKLSAEPSVALRQFWNGEGEPWAMITMDSSIYAAPIFANGTLYVSTNHFLYAIAQSEPQEEPQLPPLTGNWPQWRGPHRDNRSLDQGLLQQWPDAGPPLLWQVDNLGDGIASVSVADGRVMTQTVYEGVEYAVALHEATGELRWITPIGKTKGQENLLMRW